MNDKFFLDTNVLVYAFDRRSPAKLRIAENLISRALQGEGCIASQVVQEFINVALTKFKPALREADLREFLRRCLMPLCAVFPSEELYERAIDAHSRYRLSWYDALIIASAQAAEVKTLYSEDFSSGARYGSLIVVDPF